MGDNADTGDAPNALILFCGSLEFGGHEVMTLVILERLLGETTLSIHVVASAHNARLVERLTALAHRHERLALSLVDATFPKFQAELWPLHPRLIGRLVRLLRRLPPGPLVVAAGGVEQSALGVVAGRLAGRRVCVYLPFGHSVRQSHGRLAAARDALTAPFFRLPHRFITINRHEAANLRRHGTPERKIALYLNLLPPAAAVEPEGLPAPLAQALAATAGRRRVAVIGRIHFRQKAQDWLVRLWAEHGSTLGDAMLMIVGDGPDRPALESLVKALGLSARVTLLPWLPLSPTIYRTFDLVCLASRTEGTPLVVVEAVLAGTPVVAARVGGIPELLPPGWTYDWGDAAGALRCLTSIDRTGAAAALADTRAAFERVFLRPGAGAEFARLVIATEGEPSR